MNNDPEHSTNTEIEMSWKYRVIITIFIFATLWYIGIVNSAVSAIVAMAYLLLLAFIPLILKSQKKERIVGTIIYFILVLMPIAWLEWKDGDDQTLLGFVKACANFFLPIIAIAIIIGGILGAINLWKKRFPTKIKYLPKDFERLESLYSGWYLKSAGLWFLGWIILGYMSYIILKVFGDWYFSAVINAVYVAPMDTATWGFVAILVGIYLAMIFANLVLRLHLKEDHQRMREYYEYKAGYDGDKADKTIRYVFIALIFALVVVNLTTYTYFTETKIASHRVYWLAENAHDYNEVVEVQQQTTIISPGESRSIFIVRFSDGDEWKTSPYSENDIPANYPEIMNFVSLKSGVKFERIVVRLE